jgi:hypothetical protein
MTFSMLIMCIVLGNTAIVLLVFIGLVLDFKTKRCRKENDCEGTDKS